MLLRDSHAFCRVSRKAERGVSHAHAGPQPLKQRLLNRHTLPARTTRATSSSQEAQVIDVASTPVPSRVRLNTTDKCELGISIYPNFGYNAAGGGGSGTVKDMGNGLLQASWDIDTLVIPDLDWRTGSLFRLPIPPPINIAIKPQRLEGTINRASGEVSLDFDCEFFFSIGPLYAAPPLVINTLLTTETARGRFRDGTGSRLNGTNVRLVGTSNVPKTGDFLLDAFLLLPTDALAVMDAELIFE